MSAATAPSPRSTPALLARTRSAKTSSGALWQTWIRRVHTRRSLAALHPEQVREAGLDPHVVAREIRKPFWRA